MSLLQVTSEDKLAADMGQTALFYNKGYKFENNFNSVLTLPPMTEVALHSGQFTVDTTAFLLEQNENNILRCCFAQDVDQYKQERSASEDVVVNEQYPYYPTKHPFYMRVKDGYYNTV